MNKKKFNNVRPMSAQTFVNKNGNNNNSSKMIKTQARPVSAAVPKNNQFQDKDFELRLEEAEKAHYEFDPLKNISDFSDMQGIFY